MAFVNPFGGPTPLAVRSGSATGHPAASHPNNSPATNSLIAGFLGGGGLASAAASAGLVSALGSEVAGASIFGAAAIPLAAAGLGLFLAQEFQGKPKLTDTRQAQERLAQSTVPALQQLARNLEIWVRNGVPLSTGVPQLRQQLT